MLTKSFVDYSEPIDHTEDICVHLCNHKCKTQQSNNRAAVFIYIQANTHDDDQLGRNIY
jgi:hypothetical protein